MSNNTEHHHYDNNTLKTLKAGVVKERMCVFRLKKDVVVELELCGGYPYF